MKHASTPETTPRYSGAVASSTLATAASFRTARARCP
eukprot:CAMPEP_0115830136 /NCGR_PEP_ID=MMETSP0287-20121206/1462_1 /TAXON_ID=412157 /ORGANISM="Chrysochromulina rotalis, Strain UIO044" /LENGTH=36 /DNA_ID= /DNA_START= /DNA_END= /DNA_ORIENTATION=